VVSDRTSEQDFQLIRRKQASDTLGHVLRINGSDITSTTALHKQSCSCLFKQGSNHRSVPCYPTKVEDLQGEACDDARDITKYIPSQIYTPPYKLELHLRVIQDIAVAEKTVRLQYLYSWHLMLHWHGDT
jgi:hypothetical protein